MFHNIYEYFIYGKKNGINEDRLTFYPAKVFSPYFECMPDCLNRIEVNENKPIEVNPLFRYSSIFCNLFAPEYDECLEDLKKFIFDYWIHDAYETEMYSGMTRDAFYRLMLYEEIQKGYLGEGIKKELSVFTDDEQEYIMLQLMKMYVCGSGAEIFRCAITYLFPDSCLYAMENKRILIYINQNENLDISRKIDISAGLFLPLGTETDIFWNKHFGIIGIDGTMILDEIELY